MALKHTKDNKLIQFSPSGVNIGVVQTRRGDSFTVETTEYCNNSKMQGYQEFKKKIIHSIKHERICNSSVCYMGFQTKEVHNMNEF